MIPFPYTSRAVSGGGSAPPVDPDTGTGLTVVVRASSQPYYDAANPVPTSYGEPSGNRWAQLQLGINGVKVGSPLLVTADNYEAETIDLVFTSDVQIGLVQTVQIHYLNDWGAPVYTGAAYTDRNAVVEYVKLDPDGLAVTLNATDATYVRVASTGNTELPATTIGAVAGYWDFRQAGDVLGSDVPTDVAVLTRSGTTIKWKGGTTKLWGTNFRVWAPFDAAGAPVYTVTSRDFVYAQMAEIKTKMGANAVRLNIAPGEYRFWRDEGSFWTFLDGLLDRAYDAGLFVELNWWCVGAPGLPYTDDDSWASADYQPFYDTDEALCEEFWTAAAARYKGRGYVVFSLWDEPLRQPNTTGTLAAGSTTTATLPGGSSSVTDYHKGRMFYATGGAGSGQTVLITGYNGTTKVATFASALGTAVDNTTTFSLSDTFAYIHPFLQGLIDIIRGEDAPNLISIPGQHYSMEFNTILTSHTITDATENWMFRFHSFSSSEPQNYIQFTTSGGTVLHTVRPLCVGGAGYAPATATAPSGDFATWLTTYAYVYASCFYWWDWSAYNEPPMLATGYPVYGQATSYTNFGEYCRQHAIAPRLSPQSGAVSPPPPPSGSTAWTPTQRQAQMLWWWTPDDVTKDGSNIVSAVNDQGPNNYDLAGVGAPVWSATSFGAADPGITFDGVDDKLRGAVRVVGTAATFVVTYQWVSGGPVYGRALGIQNASTGDDYATAAGGAIWYNDNDTGFAAQRAVITSAKATFDTTNPNIAIIRFTGSQVRIRVNGTNLADTALTGAFDANFASWGGSYATSNVAKVILSDCWAYNYEISDSEAEYDEGYIAHERTSLLPRIGSGHRFYAAAPTTTGAPSPPPSPPPPPPPVASGNILLRDRSRVPLQYLPAWAPTEGHFTKDVVVSVSGNDANSGSDASPVRTLTRALARATELGRAGTQILLKPDQIYRSTAARGSGYAITTGGTSSNWFAIRGYPGMARPIFQCGPVWSAFLILANYVMIDGIEGDGTRVGFTMENNEVIGSEAHYETFGANNNQNAWGSTNGDFMYADGTSGGSGGPTGIFHHILMYDCVAYNFPGSGFATQQLDYFGVYYSLASNCARFSRYGKHGFSINGAIAYADGASGVTTRSYMMWNVGYRCEQRYPSTFINNSSITDGNFATVDQNNRTGYPYRTMCSGNLGFDCGGAGIVVTGSDNVDMFNNTFYANNRIRGAGGEVYYVAGPRLNSTDGRSLGGRLFSNVLYSTLNSGIINYYHGSTGTSGNNCLFGVGPANNQQATDRYADPRFVTRSTDPSNADFRLRTGSPAIGLSHATNRLDRDILGNAAVGTPPAGCFFVPA